MNYHALWQLEQDIDRQMEKSPAFALFNREKIKRFGMQNQHRLSVMHKQMDTLRDTYVKKDDEGVLMTKSDDSGKKVWVFEDEETEKKYLAEWNEFMQITFDIHI